MTAGRSWGAAAVLALACLAGGCCCTCPGVSTNALLLVAGQSIPAEAAALHTIAAVRP